MFIKQFRDPCTFLASEYLLCVPLAPVNCQVSFCYTENWGYFDLIWSMLNLISAPRLAFEYWDCMEWVVTGSVMGWDVSPTEDWSAQGIFQGSGIAPLLAALLDKNYSREVSEAIHLMYYESCNFWVSLYLQCRHLRSAGSFYFCSQSMLNTLDPQCQLQTPGTDCKQLTARAKIFNLWYNLCYPGPPLLGACAEVVDSLFCVWVFLGVCIL
jgi:hypothetical protein